MSAVDAVDAGGAAPFAIFIKLLHMLDHDYVATPLPGERSC